MGGSTRNKLDWFPFYAADWLTDPGLRMASHTSQSIWVRLLCFMYLQSNASVTLTSRDMSRLVGCDMNEIEQFLSEAEQFNIADISTENGRVTVTSRRALREIKRREQIRESDRNRSARYRASHSVTVPSRDNHATQLHIHIQKEKNKDSPVVESSFEQFWTAYPRREGRKRAQDIWRKLSQADRDLILADVPKRVAANWAGTEPQYIPHASTYLNGKRWLDELKHAAVSPYKPPAPRAPVIQISDEKRRQNMAALGSLIAGLGGEKV